MVAVGPGEGPPGDGEFRRARTGEFDRTESRARADWGYLDRLRDRWKGNLVVKGVLAPADAARLKEAGVDAIQVSSHGREATGRRAAADPGAAPHS